LRIVETIAVHHAQTLAGDVANGAGRKRCSASSISRVMIVKRLLRRPMIFSPVLCGGESRVPWSVFFAQNQFLP
jgi:hypothetical protein